jgi:hypothetical protein
MDFAVNQRLNLSDRNCLNLCERYRMDIKPALYKAELKEHQFGLDIRPL